MDHRKPKIKLPEAKRACCKCGWQWYARVQQPAECPACKSRGWNGERKESP